MKIYHIPISKFLKNAEFLWKTIENRSGTRIATAISPLDLKPSTSGGVLV